MLTIWNVLCSFFGWLAIIFCRGRKIRCAGIGKKHIVGRRTRDILKGGAGGDILKSGPSDDTHCFAGKDAGVGERRADRLSLYFPVVLLP